VDDDLQSGAMPSPSTEWGIERFLEVRSTSGTYGRNNNNTTSKINGTSGRDYHNGLLDSKLYIL
jgi:hypothetical protein